MIDNIQELKSPDFYLMKMINHKLYNIRIIFPIESDEFIEWYIIAMEEIKKSLII